MRELHIFLHTHYRWIFPCLLIGIMAPVFSTIDLSIARYYFELGKSEGQVFYTNSLFNFLYRFGPWPAISTSILATIVFVASYFVERAKKYRRQAFCLFLAMALGCGLIVHAIFKDHWGRPRPKQVIEFGGNQEFRAFYQANLFGKTEPAKGFPCGHCSTGFYFFSLALVFWRMGKKRYGKMVFWFSIFWGGIIGLARMAQGGHFFSDVVMAGLMMWLTALICDWLTYKKKVVE